MEMSNDLATLPRELLAELFRRMVLVREFELRAIEERRAGLIPGFIHSCVGQEASAVGACLALEADDVITSTHRGHGHLIGKGGDPRYMMAELAARSTGYCRGRGGSLHIADFDLGILGANGIVAGGIPIAVGAALAFSMRGERRVALSFFGDGAVNEGAFHEAANLAGLWKLPVIFFCENNLYGEGTPQSKQAPVADLAVRAEGYGFPGVIVDGQDVLAVYEAVQAGCRARPRRRGADLCRGQDLPLSRPLRGRPPGLPPARRDGGMARPRPDPGLSPPPARRGRLRRGGAGRDRKRRPGAAGRSRGLCQGGAPAPARRGAPGRLCRHPRTDLVF